ncbi:MAG TPA: HAMP domain-containing protein, partial [Herpetosiphonaceae bacterium]
GDVLQPPFYRVGTGELTMVAARRLASPAGAPVAVLAGYLDLDVLSDLMLERNGLGASGETYLVSLESNYLLTPSRFEGYPLTRAYRSEGIDRALGGADGEGSYANYRQPAATVLGVYRWMPELQAGLLSEIESAEALSGQRRARDLSIGLGALTLLFAVTLGLWQAARIARPILAMNAGAARVAAGNLSQPVVVRRRNELGALAKSFNHMTEQLRQTQEGLEQRVAERTAELAQSLDQRERLLLDLRDSLAAREQLSATIRALSSPVLPLLEGLVVMPLVGEIDAARSAALVESLLHAIESQRAKMAIIDVTGVPLVDTHIAAALLQAARAARLLGAQPILAGVRPELAETIVSLGLDLSELQSYPDLRGAVSYALARGRSAQRLPR